MINKYYTIKEIPLYCFEKRLCVCSIKHEYCSIIWKIRKLLGSETHRSWSLQKDIRKLSSKIRPICYSMREKTKKAEFAMLKIRRSRIKFEMFCKIVQTGLQEFSSNISHFFENACEKKGIKATTREKFPLLYYSSAIKAFLLRKVTAFRTPISKLFLVTWKLTLCYTMKIKLKGAYSKSCHRIVKILF